MPADFDVDQETEFNREKLGTVIPQRLQKFLDAIELEKAHAEEWYAILAAKIVRSVARVCKDLLETTDREALTAAASNARNLLELWIWIEYCSASRANAWRFHEDALRDMLGLTESLGKMCDLTGVRNEFDAPARKALANIALEKLGLESLDRNYERVRRAACSVDMEKWYLACNGFLSKFAHPTAGLVLGIMHQGEKLRDLQVTCTTQGVYYAGQCVIGLGRLISAMPSKGPEG
jgi:hypothetical protein